VAWQDLFQGEHSHRFSDVESARFGLRVSRFNVPVTSSLDGQAAAAMIADSADDVVIIRYPADRVDWFASLMSTGWSVLIADALGYWSIAAGDGRRRERLVAPVEATAQQVGELVQRAFDHYPSHYLANPLFDPKDVLEGYVELAETSFRRDGAITLGTPDGALVAIAAITTSAGVTEWGLAGVDPDHQGGGALNDLAATIEDHALAHGCSRILTSTVVHNTRAQKAFLRFGFEPAASFLTVHAVRPGLLPFSR